MGFVARNIPKRIQAARHGWALKPILTLTRDVAAGEKLANGDLSELHIPESFVQPADLRVVVGRTVTLAMVKGDVLA